MKRPKKKKVKTYSALKRSLDQLFSRWLRLKGSDSAGQASCFTCGLRSSWTVLQCGHFIQRQYLAGRWNEANCRIQCVRCNIFMKGAYPEFALNLGQETVAHLVSLKRETVKLTRADLQEMISHYENLLEHLTHTETS